MPARLAAAVAALLLAACSGSSDEKTVDPGPSPHVLTAGATGVPIATPLSITLPAETAPGSLLADNVTLRGQVRHGPVDWAVDVSLDAATKVLTVTPRRALLRGDRYELRVEGLTDAGATALAPVSVPFRAAVNPIVREFFPNGEPPAGWESGSGGWRFEYTLAEDGDPLELSRYYSTGLDGRWFTADDPLYAWTGYEGTPEDGEVISTFHIDAGPDHAWRTADDPPRSRTTLTYDAHGHLDRRLIRERGADGTLDTEDDTFTCREWREDEQGLLASVGNCGAGDDGAWATEDDTYATLAEWSVAPDGAETEMVEYGPGTDGTLGTADDAVTFHTTWTRSPGRILYHSYRPGPDGVSGTVDDVLAYLGVDELDDHEEVVRYTMYSGPGLNGIWGNADDLPYEQYTYTLDERGLQTGYQRAWPGGDDRMGTSDDLVVTRGECLTDR